MAIYTSFAKQLSWGEYFKLVKKLLHKLQQAATKSRSVSAHGAPELQKEKIITKALCRVLAGFHFEEVKDAIDTMVEKTNELKSNKDGVLWNNDFSDLLQKQL